MTGSCLVSSLALASAPTATALTALATAAVSLPRGGSTVPASSPVLHSTTATGSDDGGKNSAKKTIAIPVVNFEYYNQLWYSLPEICRFFVSGNLGNLCFFAIERGVFSCLGKIPSPPPFLVEQQDSISFFVGYLLQIVTQHLLHAWLVYGLHSINTREKYLKTLGGQASAYGTALIGSTLLNIYLRKHMPKNVAFVTTLYLFAIINYFVIGWITRQSIKEEAHEPTKTQPLEPSSIPTTTHEQTNTQTDNTNLQQAPQEEISSVDGATMEDEQIRDIPRGGATFQPTSRPRLLNSFHGNSPGWWTERRLFAMVMAHPTCECPELHSQQVVYNVPNDENKKSR
ncbi:expressed unknown protein [Seminavis robusta]|uniref:Uncharacterized protein n=1 Tax=Seminavis robusta TaxID=568900 RepID=A0A9N8DC08_9STRA|nr:expressed unknown protein [Seminavis robusta]|eukprot:Sro83_g044400.1 n/a (343) ;mRNA; f:72485-73513